MRFVSQFTNFIINIRSPKKKFTEFGVDIVEEEIVAEFSNREWNQRDLETALASFRFRGQYQYEDQATPVTPTYRISVYDTEEEALRQGWDEETKLLVEKRLMEAGSYGSNFVAVTEVALQPPWPTYNQFEGSPEELVVQALDLGYDPETIIVYEESKWGLRRPEVIEAFRSAIEARDAGEIIVT